MDAGCKAALQRPFPAGLTTKTHISFLTKCTET